MKKNICYFVNNLVNGGVEAVLYNYLSKINLEEYNIVFITSFESNKDCCEKFKKLGAKIYEAGNKKRFITYTKKVINILKTEKINIIHSHIGLNNFIPSMIGYFVGIKVRISHSHIYKNKRKNISEIIKYILNKLFSNCYVACGEKAGQYVFGKSKKIIYLKNAIDIKNYEFSDEIRKSKRKELLLDDKNIYGNVGRFAKQKNQLFLLDIFNEIQKKDKKAHLLMIGGDGDCYEQIIEKIKKLNLKKHVTILKNRNDVNELYQAMDILLLPSLLEGFPLVALEAETSCLPVILSDEITREAKINTNVAFLPINNCKLWANQAINMLKSNDRKKIKNNMLTSDFNINISYNNLNNIYNKLLKGEKKDENTK